MIRVALCAAATVALGFAAYECARRSLIDDPANPKFWARRAAQAEDRGESAVAALTRAVELAPREAIYASRLGLAQEAEGDLVLAEFALRRGAELSRKFEPQWDLLNFFFRRARWDEFWKQAEIALAASYGDRIALFDLCWRAEGGVDRLEKLLSRSGSMRVAPAEWCEKLVERFETAAAQRVCAAFPWHRNDVAGVTIREAGPDAWNISLSGEQPEQCVLLTRVVGSATRLEWSIETDLTNTGLTWSVATHEKSPRVLAESGSLAGGPGSLRFAGDAPVRIALQFRRPVGAVRAEGRVQLGAQIK